MGFFSNFFRGWSPAKLTTTLLTGGISSFAPKVFKPLENIVGQTLFNPALLPLIPGTGALGSLSGSLLGGNGGGIPGLLSGQGIGDESYSEQGGGRPMGFNIGGFVGNLGTILGQVQNPYFKQLGGLATGVSQFIPQNRASTDAFPVARRSGGGIGPQVMVPAVRSGAMVARGFFNRFPNLATSIQQLRARGQNIKRSQLFSLLKRFGPEVLISGGLLTAAAVNELMIAGAGRRRMNPGNIKALRKSMRRVEAFHKICGRADKLAKPRRRSTKSSDRVSQFVRQG